MALPRLTKLELQIMETLWSRGALSVREIQEGFAEADRPAYTTVQTMVYRLESKKAIRRVKKIGNAHIRGRGLAPPRKGGSSMNCSTSSGAAANQSLPI